MTIRNMKKGMKPLVTVFIIAFALTIVAGLFGSWDALTGGDYALKLNGKKIEIAKIERAFQMGESNFKQQYGESLNIEELKLLIFNNIVEQELLLQNAKELKVNIADKEIEDQMQQIEKQFPDTATFTKALQAQGFTKETLKKEIEDSIKLNKVREAIESQAKVTEEELKAYYEENKYSSYLDGKTYDSVKKELEDSLIAKKKEEVLRAWLEKQVKEAKYKFPKIRKQENPYKKYQVATAYEKDGFTFTNADIANRKIMARVQGLSDETALEKMAKEGIDKELVVVAKAKALGLKIDENLAQADKISAYREAYQKSIIAGTKVTEKELQDYFTKNNSKYVTPESFDFQVIELSIKPSLKDQELAKAKADKILKESLEKDAKFEDLAKKYSEDGSAADGGYLGWFGKGQMVKEFEEAAFAGEKGKVIPQVIKTQFGYHIIKVENKKPDGSEVEARHILITFKVGADTITTTNKKASELVEQIKTGKTTFEKAGKEWSIIPNKVTFANVKKGEYVQELGQDETLFKGLENSKLNEVTQIVAERAFVFKKTKFTPFKPADYSNVKNRVQYDLVREKAGLELKKLYQ